MKFEDYFFYDETSPTFLRWKIQRVTRNKYISGISVGDVAGTLYNNGYYCVSLSNKKYLVHRVICCLNFLDIRGLVVDHIDGNKTNNHISNLRAVTTRLNTQNSKKPCNNKSGVVGVSFTYKNGEIDRVMASCYDLNKHITKSFSIRKYGFDTAFKLACEAREQIINSISKQDGCGYTERHGK